MTNATYTPGPWAVEPLQWDDGASIAIVAAGQIIATISPENEDESPDMHTAKRGPHDEANALLIAAAPLLLETLRIVTEDEEICTCHARSWFGDHHDTQCPITMAGDAIAKAMGA